MAIGRMHYTHRLVDEGAPVNTVNVRTLPLMYGRVARSGEDAPAEYQIENQLDKKEIESISSPRSLSLACANPSQTSIF